MSRIESKWAYTKGLHDLGNGCYAYLQPDGSWGWSNAGLVCDSGESLLVDTLFDLRLTQEMLDAMRRAQPAAARIGAVVNTHSNGDHTFGNRLVEGAEFIASKSCAEEMSHDLGDPRRLAEMANGVDPSTELGAFMSEIFKSFDFAGVGYVPPATLTFEGQLERKVGNKTVRLIEVGPAHTRGDVLAYVPEDRAMFTGDMLFINGHPIIWAGPVGNWIKACQLMLDLDLETIVPGHGPVTDKRGVAAVKQYLEYIAAQARRRYDAGMGIFEAAQDIALDDYSSWGDAERIVLNVAALYKEFSGGKKPPGPSPDLFGMMARLHASRRK